MNAVLFDIKGVISVFHKTGKLQILSLSEIDEYPAAIFANGYATQIPIKFEAATHKNNSIMIGRALPRKPRPLFIRNENMTTGRQNIIPVLIDIAKE